MSRAAWMKSVGPAARTVHCGMQDEKFTRWDPERCSHHLDANSLFAQHFSEELSLLFHLCDVHVDVTFPFAEIQGIEMCRIGVPRADRVIITSKTVPRQNLADRVHMPGIDENVHVSHDPCTETVAQQLHSSPLDDAIVDSSCIALGKNRPQRAHIVDVLRPGVTVGTFHPLVGHDGTLTSKIVEDRRHETLSVLVDRVEFHCRHESFP